MNKSIEEIVEDLVKKGDDPVYRAAVDILKALYILYGSAWESELKDTLMGLWGITVSYTHLTLPTTERV